MNKKIKVTSVILTSSLLFTPIIDDILKINIAQATNQAISKAIEEYDKENINLNNLSEKDFKDIKKEFNNRLLYDKNFKNKGILFEERGIKYQTVKIAVKAMKNKLIAIGKEAFEKNIPKWLKAYISYQTVMKTLDVITGFEGELEDIVTKGYINLGINPYVAGVIARLSIAILL
ncbi:hypothetical protein KMP11_00760 [Gemella sp. zg-570]|uniref:hypothetical protein n=1 Tax=Gemella sp. zg-570 TaxID=2840371 RepID=UPI001C0DBEDD|nr:hypothetical protein [Gemella sp. zg-570]QWQ38913.1 hypothetical protein KMP11_00760 [Gemella sp. zg-570]